MSLLEQTGCEKLLYSSEMASIATSIYTLKNVDLFQIPSFEEMLKAEVQEYPYHDTYENASSKPIAVFHSSGSTGDEAAIPFA